MTAASRGIRRLPAMLLLAASALPLYAVTPDETLDDPVLEQRARHISQELRCVVCQNQTIDDSDAPLAKDLRLLVRDRLAAGDSDREVIDYVVERYGNFVLLKPPVQGNTLLLWLAPALCLLVAVAGYALYLRTQRRAEVAPLSLAEEARLAEILDAKPGTLEPPRPPDALAEPGGEPDLDRPQ